MRSLVFLHIFALLMIFNAYSCVMSDLIIIIYGKLSIINDGENKTDVTFLKLNPVKPALILKTLQLGF